MEAAQAVSATVDVPMTWPQICERFPEEWVVLVDMDGPDHNFAFHSARVVSHHARRAVALGAARDVIGARPTGSFFTGRRHGPPAGARWV